MAEEYKYTVRRARGKRDLARVINNMERLGWEYVDQSWRGVTFRRPAGLRPRWQGVLNALGRKG